MYDLLELGDEYFHSEQLEFYGNVNFMKGGIIDHQALTSRTSLQEEIHLGTASYESYIPF
jgi:starch synthase